MPSRRSPAVLALGVLAACSGGATLELEAPSGWVSALVAIDDAAGRVVLAHEGPRALRLERPADEDVEVVALFYPTSLAKLALTPGVIELDARGSRPAPPTDLGGAIRALRAGTIGPQEVLAQGDARRARIQLPPLSDAGCGLERRCLELVTPAARCIDACTVAPPIEVDAPVPPEAPRLLPCAPGWTVSAGVCVPPIAPARIACAPGEAQHARADACATIGGACPAGDWPSALPQDRPRRFVDPQGRMGPGGELSFATIADALTGAPRDAVIALSRGAHIGGFALRGPTIIGACARDTIITTPGNIDTISVGDGQLVDLTVRGADVARVAVAVDVGSMLTARGVIFEREGIIVAGAAAIDDALFRGVGREHATGTDRAVWAVRGGVVQLSNVVIEHRGAQSILSIDPGSRVAAIGLVVSSTLSATVLARAGGELAVERADLVGATVLADEGGRLELIDVLASAGDEHGSKSVIEARSGAAITARAIALDRPMHRALDVEAATLVVEDAWIRDSGARDDETLIEFTRGATVSIERATISGYERWGIGVYDAGTRATLADVVIRDTQSARVSRDAVALRVDDASLDATRVAFIDLVGSGVELIGLATGTVSDLNVDGLVRPEPDKVIDGFMVTEGAEATLTRALLRGVRGSGLSAFRARLTAADVTVIGPAIADESSSGVTVIDHGVLRLQRITIRDVEGPALGISQTSDAIGFDLDLARSRRFGVTVVDSHAELTGLLVSDVGGRGLDTRENAVLSVTRGYLSQIGAFSPLESGFGARVINGGRLRLDDVTITEAADAAVVLGFTAGFVSDVPTFEASDVTLAHSRVGISLALPAGKSASSTLEGVRLIGNAIDVEIP